MLFAFLHANSSGFGKKCLALIGNIACNDMREERIQNLAELGSCRHLELIHKIGATNRKLLDAQRRLCLCKCPDIVSHPIDCFQHLMRMASIQLFERGFSQKMGLHRGRHSESECYAAMAAGTLCRHRKPVALPPCPRRLFLHLLQHLRPELQDGRCLLGRVDAYCHPLECTLCCLGASL